MFSTRFQYFFRSIIFTKYFNTLTLLITGPFSSIIRDHRFHNTNWSKVHLPSKYLISRNLTFSRKQKLHIIVLLACLVIRRCSFWVMPQLPHKSLQIVIVLIFFVFLLKVRSIEIRLLIKKRVP